ncbi:hypothetical protein NQT62_03560 [Limnobacter humi]|uniref:Transporter n=1 Tax=Limnobacter humi TaxID=1778671 RepID=A0ABT1WDB0_9BURK|nr:hypothetical protein [Limnobacter humi]MCQ8895517.1 hypothetical protein [Limnobacter humi]
MEHTFTRLLLATCAAAAFGHAQADDTGLLLTTSFDSLKGKFGQARETKARSFTVAATYVGDDYRASVYVPYISLEGPGTFVGGTVTGNAGNATRKVSGVGDMLVSLSKDLVGGISSKGYALAATGLVKLPTGNEQEGLGTGKTDYAIQADNTYRFDSGVAITGTLGRQYYGQTPTLPLQDGNYLTLGTSFPLTNSVIFNLNASRRDRLLKTSEERRERSASLIFAAGKTSAFQLGYTTGSTTASPDSVYSFSYIGQID